MKIAIISINAHTKSLNLACPVHSWAFQQFLLKNGIESVILDYEPNITHSISFNSREPYSHYVEAYEHWCAKREFATTPEEIRAVEKKIDKMKRYRDGYKVLGKERASRFDKREEFVRKYFVKTDKLYTTASLEFEDPGFDCYICASDVIWRYADPEGFDLGLFLASSCMENKYKIAYAASRGVPRDYDEKQSKQFHHYISDFDYLAVRETSLGDYIRETTDMDPLTVLDPVLLHDASFYEDILVKPEEEKYVLLYSPEERTKNTSIAADRYCKKHNLKLVEISSIPMEKGLLGDDYTSDHVFKYDVSPEEWIGYMKYAEHIFTNSFHAICFSILFKKDFTVGSRYGDKVSGVLKKFKLSSRMINKKGEYSKLSPRRKKLYKLLYRFGLEKYADPINYKKVYEILEKERKMSSDFILGAIHDLESRENTKNSDYDSWKRALTFPVEYMDPAMSDDSTAAVPDATTVVNSGSVPLSDIVPESDGHEFSGWLLRFRIIDDWHYIAKTASGEAEFIKADRQGRIPADAAVPESLLFAPGEAIPHIPINQIDQMQATAVWDKDIAASLDGAAL